jgi:hypothetical protein
MLKLIALDEDDLAVVSAQLQDAVVLVGDMAYLPREKRFAALLNRFDWTLAGGGRRSEDHTRARAGLRIERVLKAEIIGIDRKRSDQVLSLLALAFEPFGEPPSGMIVLHFSGGAGIRLHVECIEVQLADTGAAWQTRLRPDHPDDPTPGQ